MAKKATKKTLTRPTQAVAAPKRLVSDLRQLIEQTRQQVSVTVNSALVLMYWNIGKRIREDVLKNDRAEYGKEIVATLSGQLVEEFGSGFGRANLFAMVQFAEVYSSLEIVQTLSGQLSWSHFTEIIRLDDSLKRDFYAELCRLERWSVRTLRQKIDSLLFERTAVSKKPEKLIQQDLAALRDEDRLTPDLIFRDPYFLDFLGLSGAYQEKDIEQAIQLARQHIESEQSAKTIPKPGKASLRKTRAGS